MKLSAGKDNQHLRRGLTNKFYKFFM